MRGYRNIQVDDENGTASNETDKREMTIMPEKSQKPGTTPQESKVHKVRGVQVYGRKDSDGRFANLDAIDIDQGKIRDIADILQRRGYGVMRQSQARKGKVVHLFKATWAGPGEPPEYAFEGE
jgi:hypothetical protein